MSFIEKAMVDHGISRENTWIDTLAMARCLLTQIARHNLKKLTAFSRLNSITIIVPWMTLWLRPESF
jgi:DNA polymerase-3 subunit alpha (Gram-positive type)